MNTVNDCYYPFVVNLDRCARSCNILNDLKKDYIWNPATCTCKNGKYVVSVIGDSVITCDEIIEATKSTSNRNRSSKKYFKKSCSNKKYFNKFLYFTCLFINDHGINDSC